MAFSANEQSGNATPVSFQQSQDELLSKLKRLAAAKSKTKLGEIQKPVALLIFVVEPETPRISHLSTEINNVAIAISQTINYIQLRYLTQMLDAAEHVSSQRRTRAMSNSFLSDMLSRGVKKTGPQRQGMNNGSTTFRPLEATLSKSISLTSSLLNLAGLNNNNGQGPTEIMYKLKGEVTDDRSQLTRQGIPSLVIQDLKGNPASPDSADVVAANRANPPLLKFHNPGAFACGSHTAIVMNGFEDHGDQQGGGVGQFRRSSSDISLQMAGLQNQTQLQQNSQGPPTVAIARDGDSL
ncbi:hypothetical protein BGW39_004940 [Mortierella sp. 14UC]|nr:hypothetical protein BGW39_004940 [Mortierella sp. 14UC]